MAFPKTSVTNNTQAQTAFANAAASAGLGEPSGGLNKDDHVLWAVSELLQGQPSGVGLPVFNVLASQARGDGVTNDRAAIMRAIALVTAAGGGVIVFPAGLTFLACNLVVQSATNIVFDLRGATLKIPDGSDYSVKTADRYTKTTLGRAFVCLDSTNISFIGGTIDGNRDNLNYSPSDGSGGDGAAMGIDLRHCTDVRIEGVQIKNPGTDGLYVSTNDSVGTESLRIFCSGVRVTNARRNGASLTGVYDFDAVGCDFEDTTGIAPQAGVDVEPNSPDYAKRITFTACKFRNNVRNTNVSDSGGRAADVKYVGCTFENSTYVLGNEVAGQRVKFIGCDFLSSVSGSNHLDIAATGTDTVVQGCTFNGPTSTGGAIDDGGLRTVVEGCTFVGASTAIYQETTASGSRYVGNASDSHTGAQAFRLASDATFIGNTQTGGAGASVAFSTAASVTSGTFLGNSFTLAISRAGAAASQNPPASIANLTTEGTRVSSGTAAPTIGTWIAGDVVRNRTATVGSIRQWVCTTGGTPGTWTPDGVVEGIATAGDVSTSLTPGTSAPRLLMNTTLTANRNVNLLTTGVWDGARFTVYRTAATPGAFTVNVGSGLLTIPSSTRARVEVTYSSTAAAWIVTDYVVLP